MQATFDFDVDTNALKVLIPFANKALRNKLAHEMNKAVTDTRRDMVEFLIDETGLKRKILNDAMVISRASSEADIMEARIFALFNKPRLRLGDYPYTFTTYRGRPAIKMTNRYYRKIIKTGFISADGTRIGMRSTDKNNPTYSWHPFGRSVKGLIQDYEMKEEYEHRAIDNFVTRMSEFLKIKGVLNPD